MNLDEKAELDFDANLVEALSRLTSGSTDVRDTRGLLAHGFKDSKKKQATWVKAEVEPNIGSCLFFKLSQPDRFASGSATSSSDESEFEQFVAEKDIDLTNVKARKPKVLVKAKTSLTYLGSSEYFVSLKTRFTNAISSIDKT